MDVPASAFDIYQYTTTASVCLVVYEYLINVDVEIRYLWARRLSIGTALMAICRYFPFVNIFQLIVYTGFTDLDPSRCITGFRLAEIFVFVEFVASVLVLFTRAYAVWGGNRQIFLLLAISFAGAFGGSLYTTYLFISNAEVPALGFSIPCSYVLGNNDFWIGLVILLFCESLALGLLLIKSVQHARALKDFPSLSRNILAVMAQDGIGYFACTVAISSANLVVLRRLQGPPDLRDFLFVLQGALQNILCSRLLFHVHAVNESPIGTRTYHSSHYDVFLQSQLRLEVEVAPRRERHFVDKFEEVHYINRMTQ